MSNLRCERLQAAGQRFGSHDASFYAAFSSAPAQAGVARIDRDAFPYGRLRVLEGLRDDAAAFSDTHARTAEHPIRRRRDRGAKTG
jgi:hypothetical protein